VAFKAHAYIGSFFMKTLVMVTVALHALVNKASILSLGTVAFKDHAYNWQFFHENACYSDSCFTSLPCYGDSCFTYLGYLG
jgi:hypothetical protein